MYCSSYARCLFPFLPRALSSSVPSSLCLSASRNSFVIGHGSLNYQTSKIVQGHVEVSSSRKLNCWFNTFSASQDLATKKCVPCNSKDIRLMSAQSAHELLVKVQGWDLVDEGGTLKLHRSWKVKSFTKGLEFFKLVSDVAEAEGHHPDLHLVGWNNVMIDIWTHSVGGLTENDFILAAKISSLDLQPLLRRKPTA